MGFNYRYEKAKFYEECLTMNRWKLPRFIMESK